MAKALTATTGIEVETAVPTTKNGALTLESSGEKFVDGVFLLPSMRGKNKEATSLFSSILKDNPKMALRMLLWVRDIRGGIGERELSRNFMDALIDTAPDIAVKLVPYLPEYGRWDDVSRLVISKSSDVANAAIAAIKTQLSLDLAAISEKKPFSLMAKWLPSENTSSAKTAELGKKVRHELGLTSKEYRQLLSKMRANLNILERNLSLKKYSEINFEAVPSKAIKKYKKAFKAKMGPAYEKYLEAITSGKAKINASTLVPPDLLKWTGSGDIGFKKLDASDVAQWKALPDYFKGSTDDVLVMPDLSGSMYSGSCEVAPITISVALAAYCAQRNNGLYKGVAIGFGDNPAIIKVPEDINEAIKAIMKSEVGYSTNIAKALNLVLGICRAFPDQAPSKLLVVSDMEFNPSYLGTKTNYESVKEIAKVAGIKLPQIIFWNVNGRTGNTPVRYNDAGVALVGGYNPSILKTLLSTKDLTPIGVATELLLQERYNIIDSVLA